MLSASLNPPQPPAALEREPADLRQDGPRWPATHTYRPHRPLSTCLVTSGAKQLASLLEGGATPAVTSIRLYMNEIGDEGAAALVRAALSGAVPGLKSISLDPHVESTGPIGITFGPKNG